MANKVMKITAADFEKVVRNVVNQRMKIAGAREPNEEDAPYRPGPGDGKPPWPGYPKPYQPKLANQGMTIAGNPSFDIGPGHKPASKKAKGFNKTRNNPNDKEVEMIKKWLGGPQLPDVSGASSRQIRDRLRPFTSGGPADYDKEGGSLRGVPNPLRIQLLRDAKA